MRATTVSLDCGACRAQARSYKAVPHWSRLDLVSHPALSLVCILDLRADAIMTSNVDLLIRRDFPAAKRGDREAFSRLVAATQRMVASVALAVTRDVQASEDIAQETYLTAWQRLGQMSNPDSFLPWLRQVARNRAIDVLRNLRHRETAVDQLDPRFAATADSGTGPAETLGAEQDAVLLARAMDQIPDESREVLLLFYREGQSTKTVAALLGLSDDAVRKRLERARESLREEMLASMAGALVATAPGAAFTAAVGSSLALAPGTAGAAAVGGKAWLSLSPKALLGAFGSLLASVGLVVGAVFWEVRGYLRRARNPAERRALLDNGIVYGALMATYMVVLWWSSQDGWTLGQTLAAAAGFAAAIILLAIRRARILTPKKGPE